VWGPLSKASRPAQAPTQHLIHGGGCCAGGGAGGGGGGRDGVRRKK